MPGQTIYGAAKAAVKLMTEGLHSELTGTPVKVTVIFPGAIATNITANSGVQMKAPAPAPGEKKSSFNPLPAAEAARQILDGIEANAFRVLVGPDAKFLDRFYRLDPRRAAGFIFKKMESLLSQ